LHLNPTTSIEHSNHGFGFTKTRKLHLKSCIYAKTKIITLSDDITLDLSAVVTPLMTICR